MLERLQRLINNGEPTEECYICGRVTPCMEPGEPGFEFCGLEQEQLPYQEGDENVLYDDDFDYDDDEVNRDA